MLMDADLYGGSIRLVDHVARPFGLEVTSLDCSRQDVEGSIRENTRAIYIEAPTNPMMNVSNIASLAALAQRHQVPRRAQRHHRRFSGHKEPGIAEKFRFLLKTVGSGLAPWASWLILRGIKTLGLRMERAAANAQQIAEWLQARPEVCRVIYPGLPSHPGRELMKKQAHGFGSMITFEVGSEEEAMALLSGVRLIQFAESLGGTESLLTYPAAQTHADVPEDAGSGTASRPAPCGCQWA